MNNRALKWSLLTGAVIFVLLWITIPASDGLPSLTGLVASCAAGLVSFVLLSGGSKENPEP